MALGNGMSPSTPLNGCDINVCFLLCLIYKSSYVLRPVSVHWISEMFVSGVSPMYNVIKQYFNSFLSCLIRNLTLASLSLSFTIKFDVFPLFKSFDSHNGLFP